VTGSFAAHVITGRTAKFVVNDRHQAVQRLVIAILPGAQQARDFRRRNGHRRVFPRAFILSEPVLNFSAAFSANPVSGHYPQKRTAL
jgi:hypothetical protein